MQCAFRRQVNIEIFDLKQAKLHGSWKKKNRLKGQSFKRKRILLKC